MEVKSFDRVTFKTDGTAAGEFTALIATFNKPDKSGDILRPGAFATTLAEWRASASRIPVIFSHAWKDPMQHIGEVDPGNVRETPTGIEATGRLYLDEPNGAKVFQQLQRRTLKEWSYGFVITKAKSLAKGARELLAVDLIELGPCVVGVGDTATLATKSEDVKALLAAHNRELVDEQLDPHRVRLDLVRRRLALERAART